MFELMFFRSAPFTVGASTPAAVELEVAGAFADAVVSACGAAVAVLGVVRCPTAAVAEGAVESGLLVTGIGEGPGVDLSGCSDAKEGMGGTIVLL